MPPDAEHGYVEYVTGRLPMLRRLAHALCGDEIRADDLVQQTITKLYLRWGRLGEVTGLDQYVRTMLVRLFVDERRLAWARVRLFGAPPESAAVEVGGVEDRQVLRAALTKIPRRQQAVLVLRFVHDLPISEVAQLLGCSVGTVKSQTHHGLTALRRLLDGPALTAVDDYPSARGR
jgi:RNA polymerase sigma-70 factor (sigma-E family)